MGIPTIVGIRGLTSLVKSGNVVTMDGSTGEIRLHGEHDSAGEQREEK
ncbi:MAG TPA: PEP-utilizing enzyme [Thermoanaerobaculia bacterium]|nr:PEP-utilizing enzyme [Thermoanaerobaculia bacterium]